MIKLKQTSIDKAFQDLPAQEKQHLLEFKTIGILTQCAEWLQEQNVKNIKSLFTYEYHDKIIDLLKKSFVGGMFSKMEFMNIVALEKEQYPDFEQYVLRCMDEGFAILNLDSNKKDEDILKSYICELQKAKNKRVMIKAITMGDGSIEAITNSLHRLSQTFDTTNDISIDFQMYAGESVHYGSTEVALVKNLLIGFNVSIVAAEPKLGKTTLCLGIAKAVSTGANIFNLSAMQGEVLYMSYDQSQNQMNSRIEKAGLEQCSIIFDYKEKGLAKIGVKELNQYIKLTKLKHRDLKLVIVDMFKNIRKVNATTEYSGAVMMEDMQTIKKAAMDNNVHIILIHETNVRSSKNANDKLYGGQKIASETNGSLIKLIRESPHSEDALVNIDGRNVGAYEIPVRFNSETMTFEASESGESALDQNIIKIINYVSVKKEFIGTVQELCSICKLIEYNPTKIGKMLRRKSIERILNENGIRFEDLKRIKGNRTVKLWVDDSL